MIVNADGLKKAIDDALKEMDEMEATGFDYCIGTIRGMKLRIIAEPERGCDIAVIDGDLNYVAVCDGT